jgi:lipoprotein-anchoring transpeptidase ErfK/SrfK
VTLRAALASGVALVVLAGLAGPADAQYRGMGYGGYGGWYVPIDPPARRSRVATTPRREKAEPKKDPGFGDMPKGPMQLVVSIGSQKVTLYSNGVRVAQGPVSTGVPGHPTPMGVFSVIEKDRYHHSNIYSGAPMPYMQRITWSGVALHEGVLPGYPASHGCIRMSHDFAQKLWPITKLGVRVIVARNEVAPVEFEHPKLFTPKPKPPEPQVAMKPTTDGLSIGRPIKLAQAGDPDAEKDVTTAAPEAKPAPEAKAAAEQGTTQAQPVQAVETVRPSLEDPKPAEDVKATETAQPAEPVEDAPKATGTAEPSQPAEIAPPMAPSDLRKSVEAPQPAEPAKPAEVAPASAQPSPAEAAPGDSVKPSPTIDPARPAAPRTKAADQPVKRTGQVAVFVSRKEKKIFVRQGMIPLFEMPVTIADPEQPLGTHVFTAMTATDDGAGMRWNLMTIHTDPSAPVIEPRESRRKSKEPLPRPVVHLKAPSNAAEALERIDFPKDAVDRISELLIPGSSLVISDEGLGRETGRYTEFIVLTR